MTSSDTDELLSKVPASAPGVVLIDLDCIADNWRSLRDVVSPAQCGAVVKADAYGLGVRYVMPALYEAGCQTFFVATLAEADDVRALASDATIYLLDGLMLDGATAVADSGALPVLSSIDEIEDWAGLAGARNTTLPCAIHVDSGLNRLGLSADDVLSLSQRADLVERLDLRLVMSHLACADEADHPKNAEQRQRFVHLAGLLPNAPMSLAASDGVMLGPDFHFDLARPGYAIYGGQAFCDRRTPVDAALRVFVRVLQVRNVVPGATVGYSATYSPSRPARIATLATGYADGYFRHLSAASGEIGGTCIVRGYPVPVVGRVSMDLITVDITDVPKPAVARGDWAEVVGPKQSIEAMGKAAGTIGYEVLTRLGARAHRIYIDRKGARSDK